MATDTRNRTCRERWADHKDSICRDLRRMFEAMRDYDDEEKREKAHEEFAEYGLSFDYVAPGTFNGQRRGYWRYQISWGGPSEEFRFFGDFDGHRATCDRVEFAFLDWFDGHSRKLQGKDEELLLEVWDWFDGCNAIRSEYEKVTEEG